MDFYLTAAVILIALGVALLAVEFFLPTGGIAVVGGITCFAAAVGVLFVYGETWEAVVTLLAVCVGVPVAGGSLLSAWQRVMGVPAADGADTVAAQPAIADLDRLAGRYGRTVTPMRPSGAVEIDGRRVDALSEGMMLDADVWVRCVSARAGRVIVRRMDPPADLADLRVEDFR